MPPRREKPSGPAPSADPAHFEEAVRAFRRKDPITSDELDILDAAERERSFWVSGVAEADVVQQVYDAIDDALEQGLPLADFRAQVEDSLMEAWGFADSPRIETIFRTNVMNAQNAGRYEIMTAPEVKDARPFWRLDVVDDDRQSDICADFDGDPIILPADDPFWDKHHPPLHFNAITGDTFVATRSGPVRARDVRPGMFALTHRKRWRPVTAVSHKVVADRSVLSLHLSSGRVLRVTKEHPVLVHAASNGLVWRKAGDIQTGDQVLEHGHQVTRTKDTVVLDADHAPPLANEPGVSGQIMRASSSGPVVLPVDLDRHLVGDESEVHHVRADGELRDGDVTEEQEQILFAWGEALAVDGSLARCGVAPDGAILGRVRGDHPLPMASVDSGSLSGLSPGPVPGTGPLRDSGRIGVRDASPILLRPDLDSMPDAGRGQPSIRGAQFSLQRTDASPLLPVLNADQLRDRGSVSEIEWHASTVTRIVVTREFQELCDLSVEEDATYVASGVIVHNCRSELVPMTAEEAADEGVTETPPDTEAADGFGAPPSVQGDDWTPDLSAYDDEIAAVMRDRLGL